MGAFRHGLHGPNAAWSPSDNALLVDRGRGDADDGHGYSDADRHKLRFQSVKLMHTHGTQHSVDVAAWLRWLSVEHLTLRVFDSVWPPGSGHPDDPAPFARFPDGWIIPHPVVYADAVVEVVKRFVIEPARVLDYQVDCEFNISWSLRGLNPADYAGWLEVVADRLFTTPGLASKNVRFGFPSVSFTPAWRPYDFLDALTDIAPRFQYLCVDSYFQSGRSGKANILAGPMTDRQFGGNWLWYKDWQPGMPRQIVEWANSIHEQTHDDGTPKFTPAQVDGFRLEQYPIFLEWISADPDNEAAHVYISRGATDQWGGYKLPLSVTDAMAQTIRSLHGQSRRVGPGIFEI